jgi:hypothetical protein
MSQGLTVLCITRRTPIDLSGDRRMSFGTFTAHRADYTANRYAQTSTTVSAREAKAFIGPQ